MTFGMSLGAVFLLLVPSAVDPRPERPYPRLMRRLVPALSALLILAGCSGGRGELDIVDIAPSSSGSASRPDAALYDVDVSADQLRPLLDRGAVDLQIFDCANPAGDGDSAPITFGGSPLESLSGSQISDRPDTQVRLTAEIPRDLAARPGRCARFVGRSGFEVASRAAPLPKP